MRNTSLLALCSALLFASCAAMHVTHTDVATGAVNPRAIYIRPFSVASAKYSGYDSGNGAAIRKSIAPAEFSRILQEELSKLAPAMVLKPNETPREGWLVEGEFEAIKHGYPPLSATPFAIAGPASTGVKLHVRITDVGARGVAADEKEGATVAKGVKTKAGLVVYEFDVSGCSRMGAAAGSIYAPGFGDPIPFDFRNAAERIMLTLSPDPFRYGYRAAPIRTY